MRLIPLKPKESYTYKKYNSVSIDYAAHTSETKLNIAVASALSVSIAYAAHTSETLIMMKVLLRE